MGDGVPLIVDVECRWFRLRAGIVGLGRREVLQRILRCLVSRRLAAPGAPVTIDEIFAAGWPGQEQIHRFAMVNRIRVAIATLRKLGLERAVLTTEGGYLIDPRVEVGFEDEAARISA
jgi:hypothetical protein